MELDEFTFPTTNPNNSPIDSPPLWRLSPTASPTPSYKQHGMSYDQLKLPGKLDQSNGNLYTRRSCSFLEGRCLTKRSKMVGANNNNNTLDDDDDQDQEKMDMLWEDLNYDELFKNKRDSKMIEFHGKYSKGSNEMEEFGCVPTPFKLVRTSAMKGANKKPSLLVLVKILKRLFVLQQSSKKRSR